ncbi:MAG TPA: nucleotidyltransferase family protein [Candidatus Bathyarchaeota archaeon]|nr:nucleotidyltransferase family protein [Candidatus Bathyarchaeota archaeon]
MAKAKALILCGGPGKRLRPITYYFQKTMIPVGLRQRPLLEYVIRLLRYHGIKDMILLVNYKYEQIQNYFDDGSRFNVKISYLHDDPKLKGTGGSILNAFHRNVVTPKDTLLVYYGDILTNLNIREMLEYHKKRKALVTVALASGFSVRVGLAELDDKGRMKGFVEKPVLEKPVSMGILALNGKIHDYMEKLTENKREIDLMGDVIPYLIRNNEPIYGYLSKAFWYDVGSTEAYEKLNPRMVEELMAFLFK